MEQRQQKTIWLVLISLTAQCFMLHPLLAASKELQEMEKMEAQAKTQPSTISRPKIEYNAEGLRDPFQGAKIGENSLTSEANLLQNLVVQGIVWGGSFPQAIINNRVVKIGDMMENSRVIDINKDGVTLFSGGQQYKLSSPAAADLKKAEEKRKGGQDEKR